MARTVPKVKVNILDLSTLPEGQDSLVVGTVLKAKKGPINVPTLVTSPTDFLARFTFTGKPDISDDKTFHSVVKYLSKTNRVYVTRSAKNALYGGLVVKKEEALGDVLSTQASSKEIVVSGDVTSKITTGEFIRLKGISSSVDGKYTVVSATSDTDTTIVVSESIADYTYSLGDYPQAYNSRVPSPLNNESIGSISGVNVTEDTITIAGDVSEYILINDKIQIKDSTGNDGVYTVSEVTVSTDTTISLVEDITDDTIDGMVYRNSIKTPETYKFKDEDLFLITGKDEGLYNSRIKVEIESSLETELPEEDTFTLSIYSTVDNSLLDNVYTLSRVGDRKSLEGLNIYLEESINNSSNYIKVVNNTDVTDTELPPSTISSATLSGGYDGDTLSDADIASSFDKYSDKVIDIDILTNGEHANETVHAKMIEVASTRKDIFAILNSRYSDEQATLTSQRATNIESYKKNTLSSTSFYAGMFTPHVTTVDTFNSREIKVGSDFIAVSGWLDVINALNYPYAYAGPKYGKVEGVSLDWKINPEDGEASILNNASINFIAFNPRQGQYSVWTQNTLQIANSALRNIGVVLNILDIKRTLKDFLLEYLQSPITPTLRSEIVDKGSDYIRELISSGRIFNGVFIDKTTNLDVSNDTLRYLVPLAPTRYAQNIYLSLNIVANTFDFNILQAN